MSPAAIIPEQVLPAEIPESQQTPANTSHQNAFSLNKKIIVVTGGARGLGISLAAAVLEAGGSVACLDILEAPSKADWAALEKIVFGTKQKLSYRQCDITDDVALAKTMDEIVEEASTSGVQFYGAIACAGIQQRVPAVDYPAADFERIMRVNVTGTFLTIKNTARILIKTGVKGSIVMIASMSGQIANRVCLPY